MDANKISLQFLEDRKDPETSSEGLKSQIEHRIQLVQKWGIRKGARVLEIGCGQGDCTIVLAEAVGEEGHVDAVDPGAPDYGAPFTLSQAQSYIKSGLYSPRITFHNTSPQTYLSNYTGPKYDYIVFSHSIWYFENPSILNSILLASKSKIHFLCISEWSLVASKHASQPHVLAALLLSSIESKRKVPSTGNIRTVLSPDQISGIVESVTGFKMLDQGVFESNPGLRDGVWEVGYCLGVREKKVAGLRGDGVAEKEMICLESMFDSLKASVGILEGGVEGVKSMNFWVARFGAE